MKDMMYDKGMVPNKPGFKTKSRPGEGKQSTRGASVNTGLSMQKGFRDESNASLGMGNRGKNQVPVHPKKGISTDHGEFTCY
jgi:hypothetical protein